MVPPSHSHLSKEEFAKAIASESEEFAKAYRWLEEHMPPKFLEEVDPKTRMIVARNLLSFSLQNRFLQIHLDKMAFILCTDAPDADLNILKQYTDRVIRYYRTFVSNEPPPGEKGGNLRIAILYLRDVDPEEKLSQEQREELFALARQQEPQLKEEEFETLAHGLTPRFRRSMTPERLKIALKLFFRAKDSDQCQYEVRRNEDWKKKGRPSLQLIITWRNVPKAGFLYRLARIIDTHALALQKVAATYIDPYHTENILILSLGLHGGRGKAAWDEADLADFLRELCLLKYFEADDAVGATFVQTRLVTGNEGHLIRNIIAFVHQVLVHADPNLYSFDNVTEGICRHPTLVAQLCKAFEMKFHPEKHSLSHFQKLREEIVQCIDKLDTGQALNDLRRKNILKQALHFISYGLKTNFYCSNKSAFSFRLDPHYLNDVPFERKDKFPELPYGIFFLRGMYFLGFNIRFKDLARGGVRTVFPEQMEVYAQERNTIFSEAYQLAYTQQKKNKDIPEGGAKTAILLKPFEVFAKEEEIYRKEMEEKGMDISVIEKKIKIFRRDHKRAFLFGSQRSFIESFMTLINCEENGTLRASSIVDYWKRPEYIYLGPDENMFNEMILWIAKYAVRCNYKPRCSFMTSKPDTGINHKEFGVTSYGVNVYLSEVLHSLGIDPAKDSFTVKISGGPDGDVAGNEILNLYKFYPKTAKLLAITDVSGTAFDPKGLDLKELADLFHKAQPLRYYPSDKLSEGGFLLDLRTKKEESAYVQKTLLWRKKGGKLFQEWLGGNEMNSLFRTNVHQVKADVFIPCGGRPRTLNESNYKSFLDETGHPTAKAIVEGANLYLTPLARRALEKLGVEIIKDSSCNKGGVICSSFEVLAGLCMSEEAFLKEKIEYVKEVLEIIGKAALHEARLLLSTYQKTGQFLTDLSEKVSEQINLYKYQLLDHLEPIELSRDLNHPLIRSLLLYCPPLLRKRHLEEILSLPDLHKKAMIACFIASRLVYQRGLEWSPNIADLLPTLGDGSGFIDISED